MQESDIPWVCPQSGYDLGTFEEFAEQIRRWLDDRSCDREAATIDRARHTSVGGETSSEVWTALVSLLDHGPVAVVWHEGRGRLRSDFDAVLELKGDAILGRIYQRGRMHSEGKLEMPRAICWTTTWTRENMHTAQWPSFDYVLNMVRVRPKVHAS